MRKLLTRIAPAVALLAVLGAAQTVRADEVTVSGVSTGTVTGTAANFLSFQGNNFTATTAGGFGAFSGADRIGTFTLLTSAGMVPVSGNVTLNLTFTAPAGITGGQATQFTATVTGTVSAVNTGGVQITFANPTQTFTFSNPAGTGSFTITLPNLFVQSGEVANLTAGLQGVQNPNRPIPEPATMILLGTGLAGVAAKVRKRRKGEAESA